LGARLTWLPQNRRKAQDASALFVDEDAKKKQQLGLVIYLICTF